MKSLSVSQMENIDSGTAVGCGVATVLLLSAFVGLGACTAGVGWAVIAVGTYASSLADLVYQCSNI